mmetsp:Transcript_27875/g.61724  ORF Transcript_27875/g.61724 Transcript_27875/m.61724 type:complete len:308 (-) Transcript_27875:2545-3468(-)
MRTSAASRRERYPRKFLCMVMAVLFSSACMAPSSARFRAHFLAALRPRCPLYIFWMYKMQRRLSHFSCTVACCARMAALRSALPRSSFSFCPSRHLAITTSTLRRRASSRFSSSFMRMRSDVISLSTLRLSFTPTSSPSPDQLFCSLFSSVIALKYMSVIMKNPNLKVFSVSFSRCSWSLPMRRIFSRSMFCCEPSSTATAFSSISPRVDSAVAIFLRRLSALSFILTTTCATVLIWSCPALMRPFLRMVGTYPKTRYWDSLSPKYQPSSIQSRMSSTTSLATDMAHRRDWRASSACLALLVHISRW